jgi:CBS domain-containing protein
MKTEFCRAYLTFLRDARELAQKDSEDFAALIQAFERIGAMEKGRLGNGFGAYKDELLAIANQTPLHAGKPAHFHASAGSLFSLVNEQRNDAVHQGIIARNLVRHSVEFSLTLEHAVMNMENMNTAADLMVRDVCYADRDHPVSYIRQRMLVNAFSFLPVRLDDNSVKMLSDASLAKWLRRMDWSDQKLALVRTLRDATSASSDPLELIDPVSRSSSTPISELVNALNSVPILLHEPGNNTKIVGLISAFDLL